MRAVLIGTDFMFKQNGDIVPIEINTNVGYDIKNRLEDNNSVFNLTNLISFIKSNQITQVDYIGSLKYFSTLLQEELSKENVKYYWHKQDSNTSYSINIPDTPTNLIIRSSYDSYSILDTEYCANKLNFLDLIKNETFGSEYAYINEVNELVSNISSIPNNGLHPNFILKSPVPNYDKNILPRLFKIFELNEISSILNNEPYGYFMMPFYLNQNKLYYNYISFIRDLSILVSPTLESINVGRYTKVCGTELPLNPEYNNNELLPIYRTSYLPVLPEQRKHSLLEDSDIVKMADGTFKTALDLQVGDTLKSIIIPNPDNVDLTNNTVNYHIDLNTLLTGSTFSQSILLKKDLISEISLITKLYFSDGTIWYDTEYSSYLVNFNNEVRFMHITDIPLNITILMINTSNMDTLQFVEKTIINKTIERTVITGWEITVSNDHIFLTGDEDNMDANFLAIEHNASDNAICDNGGCASILISDCDKGFSCVNESEYIWCSDWGDNVNISRCRLG